MAFGTFLATDHAKRRWAERFPGLDMTTEWNKARGVGNKLRKKLRMTCPAHLKYMEKKFHGRYLLASEAVVFVMSPPRTIVTVLKIQ